MQYAGSWGVQQLSQSCHSTVKYVFKASLDSARTIIVKVTVVSTPFAQMFSNKFENLILDLKSNGRLLRICKLLILEALCHLSSTEFAFSWLWVQRELKMEWIHCSCSESQWLTHIPHIPYHTPHTTHTTHPIPHTNCQSDTGIQGNSQGSWDKGLFC